MQKNVRRKYVCEEGDLYLHLYKGRVSLRQSVESSMKQGQLGSAAGGRGTTAMCRRSFRATNGEIETAMLSSPLVQVGVDKTTISTD